MSVDNYELFRRQRRNLTLYAVFVILFGLSDPHTKVNLLSNKFVVDPYILMIGVYSILIYFLWRYWGYFSLTGYGELSSRITSNITSYLMQKAKDMTLSRVNEAGGINSNSKVKAFERAFERTHDADAFHIMKVGFLKYEITVHIEELVNRIKNDRIVLKNEITKSLLLECGKSVGVIKLGLRDTWKEGLSAFLALTLFSEWFSEYIFPLILFLISLTTMFIYYPKLEFSC